MSWSLVRLPRPCKDGNRDSVGEQRQRCGAKRAKLRAAARTSANQPVFLPQRSSKQFDASFKRHYAFIAEHWIHLQLISTRCSTTSACFSSKRPILLPRVKAQKLSPPLSMTAGLLLSHHLGSPEIDRELSDKIQHGISHPRRIGKMSHPTRYPSAVPTSWSQQHPRADLA